jgi:hypothetical protein
VPTALGVNADLALFASALRDLGVIASVQPRGFIPHAIAERLGLPRSCAVTTYEDIAHLGRLRPRLQSRARPVAGSNASWRAHRYVRAGRRVHARGGDPRSRMMSLPVLGD